MLGTSLWRRKKNTREKVLAMIPAEGRIRWFDIEKRARSEKMSLRTVRKYLNEMEGIQTRREVDGSLKPPGVYYKRIEEATQTYLEKVREVTDVGSRDFESLIRLLTNLVDYSVLNAVLAGLNMSDEDAEKCYWLYTEAYLLEYITHIGLCANRLREKTERRAILKRWSDHLRTETDKIFAEYAEK